MSEIVGANTFGESKIDQSNSLTKALKVPVSEASVNSQKSKLTILTKRAPLPSNLKKQSEYVSKQDKFLTDENESRKVNTQTHGHAHSSTPTNLSRPVSPPQNKNLSKSTDTRTATHANNVHTQTHNTLSKSESRPQNTYTDTTSKKTQKDNFNSDIQKKYANRGVATKVVKVSQSLSKAATSKPTSTDSKVSIRPNLKMGNTPAKGNAPCQTKADIPPDVNKNGQSKAQVQTQRRRLSLSQSAAVRPDTPDSPRGQTVVSPSHNLNQGSKGPPNKNDHLVTNDGYKETAGAGRRRLSVSGVLSTFKQDNFENKKQELKSDFGTQTADQLHLGGIGYSCKKGLKPESPNQDDFFIFKLDEYNLYGVFDGHGPFGHDVSNYVQRELPKLLSSSPYFYKDTKLCLRRSFNEVHKNLDDYTQTPKAQFDCTLSGTTATTVLHKQTEMKLYIAHVGDSRCVLGRKTPNGGIEAVDLTNDHKPNSESEEKRIIEAGGEVRRLEGDIPHRVFVKGKYYPGLAMSRAIGDTVGTQAGIISDPDISTHIIDPENDMFIILCSDGVWEFITSEEAVNLVHHYGYDGVQDAANELSTESWNRWINEEGNVVDDITIEIIYLNTGDK